MSAAVASIGTADDRAGRRMVLLTALSRVSGMVRIWVVLNVLAASILNDVYQSTNYLPNILFELLAAGALQAVLVPELVASLSGGDRRGADRIASTILLRAGTVLLALSLVGAACGRWLLRLPLGDLPTAQREDAFRLGTFMLWFFLPQVVLYLANAVATAVLNANDRFGLPVVAPLANNVVVVASYLWFDHLRAGAPPSLDLSGAQKLVLAGGTTAGVVVFCTIPVVGAWRTGARPARPLPRGDAAFRGVLRRAGWAAGFLAVQQITLLVVMRLATPVPGHFSLWQAAWQVFLVPHAVLAVPALTVRFPRLSRQALAGETQQFARTVLDGFRSVATTGLWAGAMLAATAPVLARLVSFSNSTGGRIPLTHAIVGFAPGVVAFGWVLFLTRACYAHGETRLPTLVALVGAVVGTLAMVILVRNVSTEWRVGALSAGFTISQWCTAVILGGLVWRRWAGVHLSGRAVGRSLGGRVAAGVAAGAGAFATVEAIAPRAPETGLGGALAASVAAGIVGTGLFLVVQWAVGGAGPLITVRTLGAVDREAG